MVHAYDIFVASGCSTSTLVNREVMQRADKDEHETTLQQAPT